MRDLRNSLAFWCGVLVALVALSLMFPLRAVAQTVVYAEKWVVAFSPEGDVYITNTVNGPFFSSAEEALAASRVFFEEHYATIFRCVEWNETLPPRGPEWFGYQNPPGNPDGPLYDLRQTGTVKRDGCTDTVGGATAGARNVWVAETVPDCPAAETVLKSVLMPAGSSGPACMKNPSGPAGYGCAVNLHGTRSYKDALGNWFVNYEVRSAGSGCTPGGEDGTWDEKANESNVTCTVMSGNVHCWEKDSTDCQYVNGEKWCFDDVDVADLVITEGGQILSTDNGLVTDDAGNPAAPDSEIARPGADGETPDLNVGHWNGGTVGGITTTGVAVPNPQQGGGVPGTGTRGTGDGDGDGDGEPFAGPELGEGDGYGDSLGSYVSAISEGPWGSALDGIGEGASGGACPVAEFNWMDGTPMSVDFHCALLEDFESLIGLLFFFGWTWIAVRVLFSA